MSTGTSTNNDRPTTHRRGLLLMLILAAQLTGCERNETRLGKVVGGSMAPVVLGQHFLADCSDCGFPVRCDFEQAEQRRFLVCPNCGFDQLVRSTFQIQDAQSVEIDLDDKQPNRWDLVAFKMPETQDAGIKRVVGLPGEDLRIHQGNLFVGEFMLKKGIEIQKETRIFVHDSKYVAQQDYRWIPKDGLSGWAQSPSGFSHQPKDKQGELDWISYHHRRCYSHRKENSKQIKIEDNYSFNQSVSRNLNPTDELFLEAELEISPDAVFGWRFDSRGSIHEFQVDVKESILKHSDSGGVGEWQEFPIGRKILSDGTVKLEFSTIDHQLIVLLDGQPLFEAKFEPATAPVSAAPLALAAGDGIVFAKRIRIWRDIFFLGRLESPLDSMLLRNADGFLVLGDNVPVSIDSRHWQSPSLSTNEILGKVKLHGKP